MSIVEVVFWMQESGRKQRKNARRQLVAQGIDCSNQTLDKVILFLCSSHFECSRTSGGHTLGVSSSCVPGKLCHVYALDADASLESFASVADRAAARLGNGDALQLFDIAYAGILHDFFSLINPTVLRSDVSLHAVRAVHKRIMDMEEHSNNRIGRELRQHLETMF